MQPTTPRAPELVVSLSAGFVGILVVHRPRIRRVLVRRLNPDDTAAVIRDRLRASLAVYQPLAVFLHADDDLEQDDPRVACLAEELRHGERAHGYRLHELPDIQELAMSLRPLDDGHPGDGAGLPPVFPPAPPSDAGAAAAPFPSPTYALPPDLCPPKHRFPFPAPMVGRRSPWACVSAIARRAWRSRRASGFSAPR
ncbi:MAG: hypothetical protein Q8P41_18490 [Pseudomonadota bacterium]|nr:hypothetical protein [Pseudomonadota bacterium]